MNGNIRQLSVRDTSTQVINIELVRTAAVCLCGEIDYLLINRSIDVKLMVLGMMSCLRFFVYKYRIKTSFHL